MEAMKNALLRSECPISYALDVFGDKWSLLILRDMILYDKKTYSDFLASEEKIATNIARDRLSKLTENGFITRSTSQARHWNIPYKLTEKAIDLVPVILDLIEWGAKHGPNTIDKTKLMEKMGKNRKLSIAALQRELRDQMTD